MTVRLLLPVLLAFLLAACADSPDAATPRTADDDPAAVSGATPEATDPAGEAASLPSGYETYRNARYGFTVAYPPDLLDPAAPPANADGRHFESADGAFTADAYGRQAHDASLDTLFALWHAPREDGTPREVTSESRGDRSFQVSGTVGRRVFHTKAMRTGDVFQILEIAYDAPGTAAHDSAAARMMRSFRRSDDGAGR